ncbi:heme o synthase [Cyanobium sp. Aljojuca 7D2]|uniref:heme o synthase n=1 Tax=Cyanobium sp. Aljojuca 7D2 TaxID=2823698 RepID=UPI0021BCD0AA|nr:heme o synthase [Cyanobium sp. Aljojuca 7D2]
MVSAAVPATAAASVANAPTAASVIRPSVKLPAWLEVAKPRLIPLLLATTLGGMALSAGGSPSGATIACTLVGGSLASAAAGVLNCLWEQELDGRMQRTSRRALPSGRLAQRQAFALAIGLTALSVAVLVIGVNPLAASLSLLGLCSYVLLYTALLKPRTTQNIVIGGVAGAIPPLVGAAAATGGLGWSSWWLFSLVMLWTPAHFWALALLLKDDYRSVGIPMLPVVKGVVVTTRAISHYAWATVAFSLLGVLALPSGGLLYGLMVLPFNARLLQLSGRLRAQPDDPQRARALFRWSIFYLFGICLLLLLARLPQAALMGPDLFGVSLSALPTLVG